MSKKSFWDELGDTIGTILFIKYGIPIIIGIIAILFTIALINKGIVSTQVDKEHSIMYTNLKKTIYSIANRNLDNNEFYLTLVEDNSSYGGHDVELEYIVKNKDYTIEKYNDLLRNEVTKVYNEIKDKELVNDTLFGHDENLKYVEIYFSMKYDSGYDVWLGGCELRYSSENRWTSGYESAMNGIIGTQERLDKAKETILKRQERLNSTN